MRFDFSRPLTVLMGIVALTLLLACANLSGLLLARAAARQREVSIRLAIGAGRGRLLRQFAAESLLLAALGGAAGLILAAWMNRALVNLFVNGGKLRFSAPTDWRVLAFTAVISLLACILAGVAPGLHAMRANLNPALKETRARGGFGMGKSLVVAQLAISMVLVVGATLFIGTLIKLNSVDRGMNTDGVLLFSLRSRQAFPPERSLATQNALLDRVAKLPGVTSVTAASVIPIAGSLWSRDVQVEGYTLRPDEVAEVGFNAIAPRYFATVQTPIVLGREFDRHDTGVSPKVTVVNESFARYFFGESSPLGKHVTSVAVTYEIVGVVKDAKYQALRSGMIKSMYIPAPQRTGETVADYTYMARIAGGDPGALSPVLQRLVPEIDPLLRLRIAQRYGVLIDQGIVTERIMAALGGFFGLLALVIACIGIFGMLAFQVSRRTNEMGVRMALGARRGDILALVLREVTLLLAAGTVIGAAAAMTLTGLAGKLLFGVTATSPDVFATAAAALCGASLLAGWIPARRAARIDPMAALRHE